jgi:hypothetical protein
VDTVNSATYMKSLYYMLHANYTATFGAPVYVNLLGEAVAKAIDPTASIKASLHPLPYTTKESSILTSYSTNIVVIFIMVVAPFIPAAFAAYIVKEREVKAKQQQMVSGVGIIAYWVSTWIW